MLAQVRGKTGPSEIIAGCSKAVLSCQIIFGNIDSWPQMLKQSCEAVMLASVDLHFRGSGHVTTLHILALALHDAG